MVETQTEESGSAPGAATVNAAIAAGQALGTLPLGASVPIEDFGVALRHADARTLTDGEVERIMDLLRAAFNGGPGWFDLPVEPADHFRWKLIESPLEPRAALTEKPDADGGPPQIIGFSGRIFRRWLVQGEERIGRDGVESALHPDYQGTGLYRRRREAGKMFADPADFSLSFGSHPASLHGRAERGTRDMGNPLDNLVRPLNLRKFVRQRSSRVANARQAKSRTRIAIEGQATGRRRLPRPALAKQAVWTLKLLRQRLRHRPLRFARGDWSIRTVQAFDDRLGPFFEEASKSFDLIQRRDPQLLNWRYTDRRAGPFTIRVAEDSSGALVGYAVVRATSQEAELADLLALPGREDIAHDLLRDVLDLAKRAGAPSMRAWMLAHHPYHRLLVHNGFLPNRRIVRPGYRVLQEGAVDLSFLDDPHARVHLMLGDTDHV